MFSLDELRRLDAYSADLSSRSEFYDWFEANSFDAYDDEQLRPICVAIDRAFSEYMFDDVGETVLKEELAKSVRPFASQGRSKKVEK